MATKYDLGEEIPWSDYQGMVSSGGTEQQQDTNDNHEFYNALFAAELAKAQKSRGPYKKSATQLGGNQTPRGGGGKIDTGPSTLVSSIHALGDPDALRALAMAANNYGGGATGVADSRDRLNQALSGGLGYDGGFSIGAMRKTGPTTSRSASGWGNRGGTLAIPTRQKNEYEKRAQTGRDREFERGQKAADLNLELEFEKKRRAEFIKQLKGMIGSAMAKTRLQSGDEQVVNFAGLPVKVPTRGFREESNFDQILSLLK